MNKETCLRLYLNEDEIREFVKTNRYLATHQDIIDSLGLNSHYYLVLKRLFPHLPKRRISKRPLRRVYKSKLSPVDILVVKAISELGEIFLDPPFWDVKLPKPEVRIDPFEIPKGQLQIGKRMLVRIQPEDSHKNNEEYEKAKFIKFVDPNLKIVLGIWERTEKAISILTTNRCSKKKISINDPDEKFLRDGDIVEFDLQINKSKVNVDRVLRSFGTSQRDDLFSFLAKKEFSLPFEFPDSICKEISTLTKKRQKSSTTDLTHIPFVTIDPKNAKDRDDAIYATFQESHQNQDAFCEIWVAIADVSIFVLEGSLIDQEALRRGNSTYFSDSVIPMLPETISNDLCSLEENKERNSITLRIKIDSNGKKISHEFIKSRIIVKFNCTYEEVENTVAKSKSLEPFNVKKRYLFENLFKANTLLAKSRTESLQLNIPEPTFGLSQEEDPIELRQDRNLISHNIVENFMITANSCVAETLSKSQLPVIYRVHENPTTESLTKFFQKCSILKIGSGRQKNVTPRDLNQILVSSKTKEGHDLANLLVLQTMTQAYYTTREIGHFGLNLTKYVHFTSPIRRYTDLFTHRLLYVHLGWSMKDKDKLDKKTAELIGLHASAMERNSAAAERKSNYRHIVNAMKSLIGESFEGLVYFTIKDRIFFLLKELCIQGTCLISNEKFHKYHSKRKRVKHKRQKKLLDIGHKIKVRLIAADPLSGNLSFELE